MSERALAFVEEWVSDHVRAEDKSGDERARARRSPIAVAPMRAHTASPRTRSETRSTISPHS